MGRHSIPDPEDGGHDEGYHAEGYDDGYDAEGYDVEGYDVGYEAHEESTGVESVARDFDAPAEYTEYGSRYRDAGYGESSTADQYTDPQPAVPDPYRDPRSADPYDDRSRYDDRYATADRYRADDSEPDYSDDYRDDYRDELDEHDSPAPAAFAAIEPQSSGGHRNEGEWTGSHRTVAPGRRGVSVGVIVALATVVAVVAGFILWKFFGDALSNRSDVAAGRCLQGEAKVAVLADPSIADQIGEFATKFNENAGPVGDHCAVISVRAADSDTVINGLVGEWPTDFGDKPALWIPASSLSLSRLRTDAGAPRVSASKSLVSSPVVLAIRPELKSALQDQNWADLPKLQSDQAALNDLGLAGWGSLRLAFPKSGDSDASALAAEAVAVESAPSGQPATAGLGAVKTLIADAPKLADGSADEAMKSLLDASDPAAAQVHAVVSTEQQVIHRANELTDAKSVLGSWLPVPAAVADFPAVLLAGDWLAEQQVAASSEFERFIREPEQASALIEAGFRVNGSDPPTSDVTDAAALGETVSPGDDNARVAVANALGAPAATGQGPAVSIMLDKSLNLPPVVAALNTRIAALPANAAVGLTTFDSAAGTTLVNLGVLSDDVDGQSRRDVLTSSLTGLSPTGGAVSFTTLRNVYAEALTDFTPGQSNSVLVITSGPHTDQSLGADGLQELIRTSFDPARPVAVDVINVGDDPDGPTWESVAQISGGRYESVPASDSPEMVAAINALLS